MDNLTHTLVGLTLARTPLGRAGRGTTVALVLASNAPDIDIVATAGGSANYLVWHRGPTHGPLGLIGLGLATAALVWVGRRLAARSHTADQSAANASYTMLTAVSMVGVLLHVLMDFPTSYGTRFLSPFDWHWFGADLMPIVDIYLLVALGAGLIFGGRVETSQRRNAAIVLVLMAALYGLRAVAHQEAMRLAPHVFGPPLPPRCNPALNETPLAVRWPDPALTVGTSPAGPQCLVEVAAIPTFLSPFKWRIVVRLSNAYELHDVDILDTRLERPEEAGNAASRARRRYPNQWTPLVTTAARSELGQSFLGFSRFPAARWVVDARTGVATVRWTDVRFVGGLAFDQPGNRSNFFTATVRLSPDGRVIEQHLGQ